MRFARQAIAALDSAMRCQQPVLQQGSSKACSRWASASGMLRQIAGRMQFGLRSRRDLAHQNQSVIGEFAEANHL